MPYALILAGGEGTGLRPLTADRPKPMLAIAGRPLLEYQVKWLRANGLRQIVVLAGYRAETIQDHFGDGRSWGVEIRYSVEEEPLGRGGALRRGFGLIPGEEGAVLAVNGDILTDQPVDELFALHRQKDALATLLLVPLVSPYGVVRRDRSGRIVAFHEKPRLSLWMNGGVYVLAREIVPYLPDRGDHETETFPKLAEESQLWGLTSQAYWRTIDSYKDLTEAEQEVGRYFANPAKQRPAPSSS